MRRLGSIVALGFALGCSGELTEIFVVVNSDLPVPGQLDSVQVMVTGSETMSASGLLTDIPLPRTVGVVHSGGSLGPIVVRVIGSLRGLAVVEASASTNFRRGRTLYLPMFLGRDCAMIPCGDTLTCSEGSCVSYVVDANGLADWQGDIPRTDGGAPCEPSPEVCNAMDDDCDGRIDEDFDFRTDSNNCGRCGESCAAVPNASATCGGSVCVIDSCSMGWDDCNGISADGCEADLSSVGDCGSCGNACSFANATATCSAGACARGTCVAGFDDCNMDASDGCEADVTTLMDCGTCGNTCGATNATVACTSGACEITMCDAGFGDCNMDASDGCEADLTSPATCGICTRVCDATNATVACDMGTCEITMCDAGFDDCNADASDGCEVSLTTVADCGSCGDPCTITDGMGDCTTGTCEVGTCDAERGDCNMDPSDGCETDTRNDEMHCGMCGTVCTGGDRCRNSVCR